MADESPKPKPPDDNNTHHGISGWWVFLIIILLLAVAAFVGWILWSRIRARRLGLPTPSLNPFASASGYGPAPARGGIIGWASAKVRAMRNGRHAPGSYEATALEGGRGVPGGRRGNALDPDEAWDSRVGYEADIYGTGPGGQYEEQEFGAHQPAAYHGAGYNSTTSRGLGGGDKRGRSTSRDGRTELDRRYDQETGRSDPFGDHAERSDMSLRGVSPRPVVDTELQKTQAQAGVGHSAGSGDSPSGRKSMFRENM